MNHDLVSRVLAAIRKTASIARAATDGPWEFDGDAVDVVPATRGPYIARYVADTRWGDLELIVPADGEHMALHDPKNVLRHCAVHQRIVERHSPTWPDGKPEYGYHWERTESGLMVEVQNVEPDPPYYCETCQVPSPCPDLRDMAEGYGITTGERT